MDKWPSLDEEIEKQVWRDLLLCLCLFAFGALVGFGFGRFTAPAIVQPCAPYTVKG